MPTYCYNNYVSTWMNVVDFIMSVKRVKMLHIENKTDFFHKKSATLRIKIISTNLT